MCIKYTLFAISSIDFWPQYTLKLLEVHSRSSYLWHFKKGLWQQRVKPFAKMHFLHLTIKLALQRDIVNVTARHFAPLTTKVAQLKLLKAPFTKSHTIYEIAIFNIWGPSKYSKWGRSSNYKRGAKLARFLIEFTITYIFYKTSGNDSAMNKWMGPRGFWFCCFCSLRR